jgi:hypothetical protein
MPEPDFMKLGMYIMAAEPTSTAHFINPSHQPVYLLVVGRQRFGENVNAATYTHATIGVLKKSFS